MREELAARHAAAEAAEDVVIDDNAENAEIGTEKAQDDVFEPIDDDADNKEE